MVRFESLRFAKEFGWYRGYVFSVRPLVMRDGLFYSLQLFIRLLQFFTNYLLCFLWRAERMQVIISLFI